MKSVLKVSISSLFTLVVFTGCGSVNDEIDDNTNGNTNQHEENELSEEIKEDEEKNEQPVSIEDNEEEKESEGGNSTSSAFDNQFDLSIGESGSLSSTVGVYKITINGAEVMDEYEGEQSALDVLVLLDVTLENIGETTLDADLYSEYSSS